MKKLKRLLYSLTIVVALVFMFPPIQSNAEDWTTYTVHVTRTGSKYHMYGCSYLKSDIPLNILDAISQGYTPCSRCNPPYPVEAIKNNTTSTQKTQDSNHYSQSESNTFTIYYDKNGKPIQDTIYRGYYASWMSEYYRRVLNNEFESDILQTATNMSTYDCLTAEEKNIYLSLSDKDREDFTAYNLLSMYDFIVDSLNRFSPVFDWLYYATIYPDKWKECNYDRFSLLMDFITNGMDQGLQATATFNVYTYINNNPDLIPVYGAKLSDYYLHYINYGQYEGRISY